MTPGTILARRYRVIELLRRESLGTFFLAVDLRANATVAVKLYDVGQDERNRHGGDASAIRTYFQREVSVLMRINSRHVPRPLELAEDDEHGPLLVCEWHKGQSLLDRLKGGGPMPFEELHPLMNQVWLGLSDIHRSGVVHRCLKPSNLVLQQRQGGAQLVNIFDFGLSKLATDVIDAVTPAEFGRALGLFSFMPPEQIGRAKTVDHRADIYACSTVTFQALSGQLPYPMRNILTLVEAKTKTEARRLSEVIGGGSDSRLDDFLARGLERDPAKRFQTGVEAQIIWEGLLRR